MSAKRGDEFQTTSWGLVLTAAGDDTTQSRQALAALCEAYWQPLYAFVRRRGYDPEQSRDLTQAYFAQLLEEQALRDLVPGVGRFRSFLLRSLQNLMTDERRKERALKRGAGQVPISLDLDAAESGYRLQPTENVTPEHLFEERWAATVLQDQKDVYAAASAANVENYVGTVRIPVGLAGPVEVLGEHAQGTYFIPMATTEGTLVASTSRGMKVINESGGVRVRVVRHGGIQRAPVFEFDTLDDARAFCDSINADWSWLRPVVEATTAHGKLVDVRAWQLGRVVCVRISMDPGDASGQNMVSIAAQNGVAEISRRFPGIRRYRMAGGLSGEKEPSSVNALLGRGKAVAASVSIPGEVMRKLTRADIADVPRHHQNYSNFAMWSGALASHNSIANTLTAMYIATGQDVAAIHECRRANNVLDYDAKNNVLHWDVHIPTLTAGTIGGGTGLPTQRECLELMGCYGSGNVDRFAELCAVAALANEISFWGAVCAHEWIDAHAELRSR
jgi:hydroxymethylglutaryl-CoA reductase (NADPH)